jgi:hypothetical protein
MITVTMDLHCHPVLTSQKLQDQNIFFAKSEINGKGQFFAIWSLLP